ncbi:MAG: hypothetical protein J7L95_01705 [Prolixibacteraceae bacterium]|nr:hypothetical protein [Prolixibacteraceae bacterium]
MRYLLLFLLLFVDIVGTTQNSDYKTPVSWEGYSQMRFTTDFGKTNSFAIRRLKLWAFSTPEFDKNWGFKIQTTFTSFQNEKFLLQDVEGFYHWKQFRLNFGQFVPHYSLQRFQHDFNIPMAERAPVINALIPIGTLGGVRDIGIEGNWQNESKIIESWLGVFNGSGIKEYCLDYSGIMLTHKTNFHAFNHHLLLGYSLMVRKADNLQLQMILPTDERFSGNDFRYNLFATLQFKNFEIQSEYLRANLEGKIANGYYMLATLNLGKNQLVSSFSKYNDLIDNTADAPEIHLAYNYRINQDKLKIMIDNGVQINDGELQNYFAALQVQIFFLN